MNERISEIWDQAAKASALLRSGENSWETQKAFIEKFAQLIVLECVNAVMDGTKEGDNYAMQIEQQFDNGQGGVLHFGVEE
jgi:hypothetical protein